MKKIFTFTFTLLTVLSSAAWANSTQELHYVKGETSPYQIPYPDRHLQTVQAKKWLQVTQSPTVLEGPAFDKNNTMLFTDVFNGRILKVEDSQHLSTLLHDDAIFPSAIAVRKDGKIFIAATNRDGSGGQIFLIDADGKNRTVILPASRGYLPNDMTFDNQGGLYFTDARGNSGDPSGGVYYLSPEMQTLKPVLQHLTGANGLALSPDGKTLWVVEFSSGVLHRLMLKDAATLEPFGETVAYRFNSPAPDSMKADSDGNLYIALHGQGRVIVLNRNAVPIGQITIPGRENGDFLRTSNVIIKPGSRDIYITSASDMSKTTGSAIFKSQAFAKGLPIK